MFGIGKIAAATALVVAIGLPASAEEQKPACGKRGDVLKHLSAKYTEAPVAIGLANNGGVLEVLSSVNGSSWTIIITMPEGLTCMVAAGENWEKIPGMASMEKQGA